MGASSLSQNSKTFGELCDLLRTTGLALVQSTRCRSVQNFSCVGQFASGHDCAPGTGLCASPYSIAIWSMNAEGIVA